MDVQEVRKLDAYLKRVFGNQKIRVVPRPKKDDSAEVYIGEEFIGVLFVDDEDDDRSFQFQMAILEEDLAESGRARVVPDAVVGKAPACPPTYLSMRIVVVGTAQSRLAHPLRSGGSPFGPCICAVRRSIALATSRHCASQLRGKRNVRSAPSMRRSLRHMPGVRRIARAARVETRCARGEQILVA